MFHVGTRVRVPATVFDKKGTNNAWSRSVFGDKFNKAKCAGKIEKVNKISARVLWDTDGKTSSIPLKLLEIEPLFFNDSDSDSENDASPTRSELTGNDGRSRSIGNAVESKSTSNDGGSKSTSNGSGSKSTSNDGGSKSTSKDGRSELIDNDDSSSSSSSSDSENDAGSDEMIDPDVIQAHDTEWKIGTTRYVDPYKDGQYGPLLLGAHDTGTMVELDFWLLFFPSEKITEILAHTNANLREKRKHVTEPEFYRVIGILYAMTLQTVGCRREYWSTNVNGLFPALAFGSRFNMGLHRFEEILHAISFGPEVDGEDKWALVRPFFDMLNNKWEVTLRPGYKLTIDESMFAWYGRDQYSSVGMPAVMKIKRKPKGVGCEIKNLADSCTRIIIRLEINEGREAMSTKEWQKEYGAGTATLLRLCKPWFGSGRIVVGDSWFGSVKAAEQMYLRGLFFIGIVKTATKQYPLKELIRRCPEERGESISASAKVGATDIDMLAMAWRDKKVHTIISTCGTTADGAPARKRRVDDSGRVFYKNVKRPRLFENYFDGAPAIDINNHIRQDGLALEVAWGTQKWFHRIFASLFGIIETNAYLAYNFFKREKKTHAEFTAAVAQQLIRFSSRGSTSTHNSLNLSGGVPVTENHVLKPLSVVDSKNRTRVQLKCRICSRIKKVQQKSSYYCSYCGTQAVMCNPATGRDYFAWHIENGLP